MTTFKPQEKVVLSTPGNPVLDGRVAFVKAATEYGYLIRTDVGSGEYRATPAEVRWWVPLTGMASSVPPTLPPPPTLGYTGDTCSNCQGSRVRRNGPCLLCDDCGTTSGCS